MKKNIILLIVIILAFILISSYIFSIDSENNLSSKVIGETQLGTVSLEGPYGNPNSKNKIAIIIGVHPLEYQCHNSLLKNLKKYSNSLNNSYYVYTINVTKDSSNFDKGRINGQILARDYVVPDINNKKYNFVVDFHGNRGVYEKYNFIIAPLNDKESEKIGQKIIKNIPGMSMLKFVPANDGHPTSPDFVSIPILKNGTPNLIYETYINESTNLTDKYTSEFLINLDNIRF